MGAQARGWRGRGQGTGRHAAADGGIRETGNNSCRHAVATTLATMFRLLIQTAVVIAVGALVGAGLNAASRHPVRLGQPVYAASASGTTQCGGGGGPEAQPAPARYATIPLAEAVQACDACTMGFIDARGAAAYAVGHIPGAVHLPPAELAASVGNPGAPGRGPDPLAPLRKFKTLVIYDDDASCDLAPGVAERLRAQGFEVRILDGGWGAWQAQGGPAQSGACRACATHLDLSGLSGVSSEEAQP